MPTIKKENASLPMPKQEYSARKKIRQSIYNTPQWKNLRKVVLMKNPICIDCQEELLSKGKTDGDTLAIDVHHTDSFMRYVDNKEKMYQKAYDINNLIGLCKYHHLLRHGLLADKNEWKNL